MVALRRTVDLRELTVAPIVATAVDNHATHCRTVAIDPLGCRLQNDVGTPLKRIAEVATRAERIIDHEGHIVAVRHLGNTLQIRHIAGRITHTLDIYSARIFVDQRLHRLDRIVLCNAALDTQLTQRNLELIVRSAIQERRGNDVLSLLSQRSDCQQNSRHTARHCQRTCRIVQRCNTLLVRRRGGVLQTGIDIAALAQFEQACGVVAIAEMVCSRRIDRHTTRAGLVDVIATMNLARLETQFLICHCVMIFLVII